MYTTQPLLPGIAFGPVDNANLIHVSKARSQLVVYADGAVTRRKNVDIGGYAALVVSGTERRYVSGGFNGTTKNRMELIVVILALESLPEPSNVTVYSHSTYTVDCINKKWA